MHAQALQENEKFEKTRSLSIEIESLDFARTIIEENADFIVKGNYRAVGKKLLKIT